MKMESLRPRQQKSRFILYRSIILELNFLVSILKDYRQLRGGDTLVMGNTLEAPYSPAPLKLLSGNISSPGPRISIGQTSSSKHSAEEYPALKAEELKAELDMRKGLILDDLIPLLLAQEHRYPKTEVLLLALARFGAAFTSLETAEGKDVDAIMEAASKLSHQEYQMLLGEVRHVINLG